MKQEIQSAISKIVQELFSVDVNIELTRPDEQFGDFATNVALQLAGRLGKNPREVSLVIADRISAEMSEDIESVAIAGPGFINITLSDAALLRLAQRKTTPFLQGQKYLLEYSCPNAFKELHTGHLYQTIAGDALGRLLEESGATVFRANFGGDVGLHVAKCLWGMLHELGGAHPEKLQEIDEAQHMVFISRSYVAGAKAYEEDEATAEEVNQMNKKVYAFHEQNDHSSELAQLYWIAREWSYEYFKDFYEQLDVAAFDKYYPESMTATIGLKLVKENVGKVFAESDGAVVFKGEEQGLHTRVFVTSGGLPTYETKDLGVIYAETEDFMYDRRVLMTGNDQSEYMKVVFAALAAIDAELAARQTHITNGTIRFADNKKMSSRLGNVLRAVDAIKAVHESVSANDEQLRTDVTLGALKYSFLKHRLGGDIAFDVNESVAIEGNSGPYLQYAHARARSILAKVEATTTNIDELTPAERTLVRKIGAYTEVVEQATRELLPHLICVYLYELAQTFNKFYENNRVIGDPREQIRLSLVLSYADTLKHGLSLLHVPAPERM